jgi:hypothetical protein
LAIKLLDGRGWKISVAWVTKPATLDSRAAAGMEGTEGHAFGRRRPSIKGVSVGEAMACGDILAIPMSDYVPASESMAGLLLSPEIPLELREETGHMATPGAPVGPPFDIPDFTISGVLPPYMGPSPTNGALMSPYRTTLTRIAQRMCATPQRQMIFQGLLDFRRLLATIGIQDGIQWLSGSFMEDIETLDSRPPRDVDVVTFFRRPQQFINDDAAWLAFLQPHLALLDHDAVKAQYHCDTFFVDVTTDPFNVVDRSRYWFGLFSHRRGGLWKGMIEVPLLVSQDDTDATVHLVTRVLPNGARHDG